MRDYMSEDVQQASIQPQRMYMRQSEKTRLNDFNVTFDRSQSVVTLVKSNHRGKQVKQFISTNPWGPLSGAMMALSLPMELGQRYSMDVFTGSTRYNFCFQSCGPRKDHHLARNLRCVPPRTRRGLRKRRQVEPIVYRHHDLGDSRRPSSAAARGVAGIYREGACRPCTD